MERIYSSITFVNFNQTAWCYITNFPLGFFSVLFNEIINCQDNTVSVMGKDEWTILAFKLSLCSECCIVSFGWFPSVWMLCVNISEHSVCAIFIGGVGRKNSLAYKIQMPGNYPKERIQHEWTSVQNWCNDKGRRKPKYSEKNQSQCHFAHHKFHMKWSQIQHRPPQWQVNKQWPESWHTPLTVRKSLLITKW